MSEEASNGEVRESLIRLEAKIDVVLSRHEGKIDDLTRRQGETSSTLRDHDSRITANALTTAETRSLVSSTQADLQTFRSDVDRKVDEIKRLVVDSRPKNIPSWVAVGVAALAVVLSPILTALIAH